MADWRFIEQHRSTLANECLYHWTHSQPLPLPLLGWHWGNDNRLAVSSCLLGREVHLLWLVATRKLSMTYGRHYSLSIPFRCPSMPLREALSFQAPNTRQWLFLHPSSSFILGTSVVGLCWVWPFSLRSDVNGFRFYTSLDWFKLDGASYSILVPILLGRYQNEVISFSSIF